MDTTSIIDPIKPPTVMLTSEEMDEIERRIEAGELPRDYFVKYYAAVESNVFGAGFKRDSKGRPIESGLGSGSNMTSQSVEAYRRWGKDEPDYERNLARMEKQLADCDTRRDAEAANAPAKRFGRR